MFISVCIDFLDTYGNELRTRAKTCAFRDITESLIRDRIVCGITDSTIRARLLREPDLDLQKTISIGRAAENTNEIIKN